MGSQGKQWLLEGKEHFRWLDRLVQKGRIRSGDGSNSARLQARITEEWEGEARDQPRRIRVFFLYSDTLG